jgi:hypothetical protein
MRLFWQALPNCDALRHKLSWTDYPGRNTTLWSGNADRPTETTRRDLSHMMHGDVRPGRKHRRAQAISFGLPGGDYPGISRRRKSKRSSIRGGSFEQRQLRAVHFELPVKLWCDKCSERFTQNGQLKRFSERQDSPKNNRAALW